MMYTTFILASFVITQSNAFSSTSLMPSTTATATATTTTTNTETAPRNRLAIKLSERIRHARFDEDVDNEKAKCEICPESHEVDRREATFAMIGTMWSAGILPSAVISTFTAISSPEAAEAVYGADAKIEVPNVMDNINNRVNQQCLVESLGNRECLVYLDPDNKLYQGAESKILVERLEAATAALALIPALVLEKKWSKIQGILTGPMNPLGVTMDKLSKMSNNEEQCCKLEKIVKQDLYAIASAVERKQGDQILELQKKATVDLVSYANSL